MIVATSATCWGVAGSACVFPPSAAPPRGERSFAWLGNFRRLLIRWEHLSSVYQGFFTVAVLLICLRRVCQLPVRAGSSEAVSTAA
jgi:hypothetical protein